jgi:exodeoxyribonuclease VII large subunit
VPDERSLSFDFTTRPVETEPRVYSVAELDRGIKGTLDEAFLDAVWVEGEVVGARPAPSGHLYFSLRDEKEEASIDAVVYRTSLTPRTRAILVDGARVRVRGRPTFWAPRGRLQFIADRVMVAGRGALLEALERLKAKLQAEGLFAAERKRPLPAEPRIVGVVTSAGGAVIHDVCKVAFRRGGARILLAPALVQGPGAAESLRRALDQLARVAGVDVIILGRGGGSADDLLAFNDEALVRAVASAVGHEVDVALTDFAADARAATPSQAAEMVVPDALARRARLAESRARLVRAARTILVESRADLARLDRELGDPRLAIASHQQRLDDRRARLAACLAQAVRRRRDALARLDQRLASRHPRAVLARNHSEFVRADERLRGAWRAILARRLSALSAAGARLDALSPLKVLARGYAIAVRSDGRAVRAASDVSPGDVLFVRAESARIEAEVRRVEEPE